MVSFSSTTAVSCLPWRTNRNQDSGIRNQGWAWHQESGMAGTRPAALTVLIVALSLVAVSAQQPVPSIAPANEWRQFRGSPRLTGQSSSTLPATLKVLWTYELGDIIESSAAIANGVVYV